VITDLHALQVFNPIVGAVSVDVVDFVTGSDWAVVVFPDSPVLELMHPLRPPLRSSWNSPAEHPVRSLAVPPWRVPSFSLEVCPARLAAEHTFVACVECLAVLSASFAHVLQRLFSCSHDSPPFAAIVPLGRWPCNASILHPSTLIPPQPCRSVFAASVPSSGLRASVIGSSAGLSAEP
jgi:hypothetical protein